jgi:hypothetical protein
MDPATVHTLERIGVPIVTDPGILIAVIRQ